MCQGEARHQDCEGGTEKGRESEIGSGRMKDKAKPISAAESDRIVNSFNGSNNNRQLAS
jgi:hypothetical protein